MVEGGAALFKLLFRIKVTSSPLPFTQTIAVLQGSQFHCNWGLKSWYCRSLWELRQEWVGRQWKSRHLISIQLPSASISYIKMLTKKTKIMKSKCLLTKRSAWKNERSPDNKAYVPTNKEHLANILTHGVRNLLFSHCDEIFPLLRCWFLLHCGFHCWCIGVPLHPHNNGIKKCLRDLE